MYIAVFGIYQLQQIHINMMNMYIQWTIVIGPTLVVPCILVF